MNAETPQVPEQTASATSPDRLRDNQKGFQAKLGRIAAAGLLTISGSFVETQPANAADGGYPNPDLPDCSKIYGKYSWCTGKSSEWTPKNNSYWLSSRGFGYRNCTDWVAWRVSQGVGVRVPFGDTATGNAKQWDDQQAIDAGFTVDSTPEPGDAAVWEGTDAFGHVAFVESVNADGTVNVSQYNKQGDGNYLGPSEPLSMSLRADNYVDFNGTNKGLNNENLDKQEDPDSDNDTVKDTQDHCPNTPGLPELQGCPPRPYKRADFTYDGKADIAWHEPWKGTLSILKSTGNGYEIEPWQTGIGGADWAGVGDFDGNKFADVVWYERSKNSLLVLINHGNSSFSYHTFATGIGGPDWAGTGDFDGDGKDDLAWYEQGRATLTILRSDGAHFGWWAAKQGLGGPTWAGVGYFNGDNKADIAWHEGWKGTITVFTHDGGQSFYLNTWKQGIGGPTWAAVGDFDGDTRDDIAWFEDWNNNNLMIWHSNGHNIFETWGGMSDMGRPDWAGTGDFDGDGKDDILWYESWKKAINVFRSNQPGGGFAWIAGAGGLGGPGWAQSRSGGVSGGSGG